MFDFENILLRAKADGQAHFKSYLLGVEECCCGQRWPCPAKEFLEETVPALVYALEGDERVSSGKM